MAILGLDISTSEVGVCIYHSENNFTLDHISVSKYDNTFDKTECVIAYLINLSESVKIDKVVIEMPLFRFAAGKSSASSISTLIAFNAIVSYFCQKIFKIEVIKVSAATARKMTGVKLKSRKIAGPQKDQVFKHFISTDLVDYHFPKKRTGTVQDWAKDAVDAYVMAKYGFLANT